jgi:hypothetical protein
MDTYISPLSSFPKDVSKPLAKGLKNSSFIK